MLRIIDRLSLAAGPPANDDAHGAIGSPEAGAAWVIDGATGVAEQSYVPGAASDAAWFAETLNRSMTRQAMLGGGLDRRMRQAYLDANAAFAAAADTSVPDHGRPLATLLVVAWQCRPGGGVSLDYASLGDGKALLVAPGFPARALGQAGEDPADRHVNAAVRALQEAGTADPAQVMSAMIERLRQSRRRAVDGYAAWAAGADGAAAFERERLELEGPATLLIATDGFYRLVDTYAAYSIDSLLKAASLLGLAELGRELRQIERADPNCRAHPRLKPMDDATAILIAAGTGIRPSLSSVGPSFPAARE